MFQKTSKPDGFLSGLAINEDISDSAWSPSLDSAADRRAVQVLIVF